MRAVRNASAERTGVRSTSQAARGGGPVARGLWFVLLVVAAALLAAGGGSEARAAGTTRCALRLRLHRDPGGDQCSPLRGHDLSGGGHVLRDRAPQLQRELRPDPRRRGLGRDDDRHELAVRLAVRLGDLRDPDQPREPRHVARLHADRPERREQRRRPRHRVRHPRERRQRPDARRRRRAGLGAQQHRLQRRGHRLAVERDGEERRLGNGIAFSDSRSITVDGVTTSGNAWGGIALYASGAYNPCGVSDVSLAHVTLGESSPLYTGIDHAGCDITSVTVPTATLPWRVVLNQGATGDPRDVYVGSLAAATALVGATTARAPRSSTRRPMPASG